MSLGAETSHSSTVAIEEPTDRIDEGLCRSKQASQRKGRLLKGAAAVILAGGLVVLWAVGAATVRELALAWLAVYCLAWAAVFMVSPWPPLERFAQVVLVSLSIGAVVLLLESLVVVRLIDFRLTFATPVFDPWRSPIRVPDPDLLWVHPPHLRLTGSYTRGNIGELLCLPPHKAQPYELRYDQHGFRNAKDLAAADIAVIGDSYVEAPYAPTEALMTTVLGELTHRTVANLGLAGFGPQQELVVLERYAVPLHPKTVVWVFFEGNDLGDVYRYESLRSQWSHVSGAAHSFRERSFTKNLLLAVLRLTHPCEPNPFYRTRYGIVSDGQGGTVRMYFREEASVLSPRDLAALDVTRTILTKAADLAQRHHIQLLVAFAPIAYRVYHHVANFEEADGEFRWWTVNDLPGRLAAIVSAISPRVGYLDLTPWLTEAARKGQLVYLPDDTHWTAEGHAVVAAAIQRYLETPSVAGAPKEF